MSSVTNNTTNGTNGDDAEPLHGTHPQGVSPSASPTRSTSLSLHAAAAVNAGLHTDRSRRSSSSLSRQVTTSTSNGRRRSQVLINLQHNDPSLPGPGEMVSDHSRTSTATSPPAAPLSTSPLMMGGDPHHNRAPSLGELHQELEAEQEAQVNRLLLQIRQQQAQILHLQHSQPNQSAIIGEESPGQTTPAQPTAAAQGGPPSIPASGSLPRSPIFPRGSFEQHGARADLRHRSRTPSRGASPRMRSTSFSQESGEPLALAGSNESAFYQAETQMLTRENQMLRHRIRDLEKQLADITPGSAAAVTREPHHHSGLTRGESVSDETRTVASGSEMSLPIREVREE